MRGILENTIWNNRLLNLNISLFGYSIDDIEKKHPKSYQSVKQFFEELEIDPISVKSKKHPTTFTDVVYKGGTYEQIFNFLNKRSSEIENDNLAMNKKLRFVGVTERTKTSPNTWRWQQRADWTKNLKSSNIKNVSVEYGF